jgi:hypothetical protein
MEPSLPRSRDAAMRHQINHRAAQRKNQLRQAAMRVPQISNHIRHMAFA